MMKDQMMDFAYIAAGGNKKIAGEHASLLMLDNKTLIEHTIDSIVRTNVSMVIIGTSYPESIGEIISSRTQKDNNYKPVIVFPSRNGPGTNFLEALYLYTKTSERKEFKPFRGELKNTTDFGWYVDNNPELKKICALATSCDVPFAPAATINDLIAAYVEENRRGVDFMALLTTKESSAKDIEKIASANPGVKKDFYMIRSTLNNFFSISGNKVRASNFFISNPFKAKAQSFSFVDNLYDGRYISQLSSLPAIRKTIRKYAESGKEALMIGKDIVSLMASNLFNKVGLNLCGAPEETIEAYFRKITGLDSRPAYFGNLFTMLDIDDASTYAFANKYFSELARHSVGGYDSDQPK